MRTNRVRKNLLSKSFFGILLSVTFLACTDQIEKDRNKIEDYLQENGLVASVTDEGLYYIIEEEGTGQRPSIQDEVKVHYEGKTLDDIVFDSSYERNQPASFPLTWVIEGWQIGIPLFKEGGSGWLYIPSHLAYGKNPPYGSGLKKNEVLIFKVELLEVL